MNQQQYQVKMKIKMPFTDTNRLLWRESPCTLRNVLQNPSMDNSKRFHYGSIYYKDEVNKPKKVFTQFEKPQLLLLNFRRQLEQVELRSKKTMGMNHASASVGRQSKLTKRLTSPQIVQLYQKPKKLQFKHDRHGNRSSYYGQFDVKDLTERLKQTKRNFYSSQRIDLSKPHNFYPGPGTYFNLHSGERPNRHTYSERNRATSILKSKN